MGTMTDDEKHLDGAYRILVSLNALAKLLPEIAPAVTELGNALDASANQRIRQCQLCKSYLGAHCAKYNRAIPYDFMAKGCDSFQYQYIPF